MLVAAGLSASVALVPAANADAPPKRAYELVSPLLKGGGDVAVLPFGSYAVFGGASADGDRMVFSSSETAVGDADRGMQYYATATRTASGWKTRSALPATADVKLSLIGTMPNGAWLSDDASAMMFVAPGGWVSDAPPFDGGFNTTATLNLSRSGVSTQWLTRPLDPSASPRPGETSVTTNMLPAGGSPDLRTAYFSYCGTLAAADAPRAGKLNLGFYVAHDGAVSPAGQLPDGTIDPDGAAAVNGDLWCGNQVQFSYHAGSYHNQVSQDGSRALFVSPDPQNQSVRPPQIYVHREGQRSLLVSRALGSVGSDTPTPAGVVPLQGALATPSNRGTKPEFAVASRDGAHVVFASMDRLTTNAPSGSLVPLRYRFDVETEKLTYLPGITGAGDVLAVSDDGERIMYRLANNGTAGSAGFALDDHGVTRTLDGGATATKMSVSPYSSPDGSTWVFAYSQPLGDSPTHVPGTYEVYRYVVGSGAPTCVSCAPPGGPPSTGARVDPWIDNGQLDLHGDAPGRAARNISTDGRRIFFDTKDALLPDKDTNGTRDVYAWEDGVLSLISAGTGPRESFLLDSSASGDDVFFATADGLVAGDTDGSYDVYDKRVGGGFADETAASCSGDGCQRPPSSPGAPPTPISGPGGSTDNLRPAPVKEPSGRARVVGKRGTHGRVTLRVRVPGAGRIVASGSGLRAARRTVKRAATYTVTVRPTAATKRLLSKAGKRRSRIRVRFAPSGGGRATTITVALTVRK